MAVSGLQGCIPLPLLGRPAYLSYRYKYAKRFSAQRLTLVATRTTVDFFYTMFLRKRSRLVLVPRCDGVHYGFTVTIRWFDQCIWCNVCCAQNAKLDWFAAGNWGRSGGVECLRWVSIRVNRPEVYTCRTDTLNERN